MPRAHGSTMGGSLPFTTHCARLRPHQLYLSSPRLQRTLSRPPLDLNNQLTVESIQPSAKFCESSYPQLTSPPKLFAHLPSSCQDLYNTPRQQCLTPSVSTWMTHLPHTSALPSTRHQSTVTCKLDRSTLYPNHNTPRIRTSPRHHQVHQWSLFLEHII